MFVLYNILQLVFLPVFLPIIILFVLFSPKYRDRIPARLSIGLGKRLSSLAITNTESPSQTIWLHALSVGEVTSAVPLIKGLRKTYPKHRIIVSVTTRSGRGVADKLLGSLADLIIDGPFDILPVVSRFVKTIQPDLFILVETDLWPNTLLYLQNHKVPTILVNGRVSQQSMAGYRRLHFFFHPMFQSFSFLCMQTQRDKDNMQSLGLPADKLRTLGNLKFDTAAVHESKEDNPIMNSAAKLLPDNRIVFICGSTHPGEEKILIEGYTQARKSHPELFLIIAPRDIGRAAEIRALAKEHQLSVSLRSDNLATPVDILILNTIGELIHFYALADIGFVGGSLVEKGGHNPIEPATVGLPVLFGPNMQDFSEIAEALIQCGGATEVSSGQELAELLSSFLSSPELRNRQGQAAQHCVESQRGVIDNHLELISALLQNSCH